MAFYDGLGKRIQQTGQEAVERTKKGAESVRINNSISNLEREIKKEYTELGRLYYQKHAEDEQDSDLIPYFQRINDKMESIQSYRDQLNSLKGMHQCPSCGKSISANVAFCNFCGARQVPEYTAPTQPASGRTCPNCGAPVEEDQRFCTECGTPMEDAQSAQESHEVEEPASAGEAEAAPSVQDAIKTEEIEEDNLERAEVGEEQKNEDEEPTFCPNCGNKLEPGDLFCTNCGQKVE